MHRCGCLCLVAVVLQFFTLSSVCQAQLTSQPVRDIASESKGAGSIGVQVFALDSGQPLAQAEVRVFVAGPKVVQSAFTDQNGHVEILGLVPGRYFVSASKDGYLGMAGVVAPKVLSLSQGNMSANTKIALPRAGVLAGRITDERGVPVARVVVNALRIENVQGRRRLVPSGAGVVTDDKGEARIFGLRPGRYYVQALPVNRATISRDPTKRPVGFGTTFYPAVTTISEAQPLSVAVATTVNFEIALTHVSLANIEGTVVDATGAPKGGGLVTAQQLGYGNLIPGKSATVAANGSFILTNLAPGTYRLQTRPPRGATQDVPVVETATVTISGQNISEVVLEPQTMIPVRGRVTITSRRPRNIRPESISVGASLVDMTQALGGQRPGIVGRNWEVSFETWPGQGLLRVTAPDDLTLRSVKMGGVDVTDTGIEFRTGQPVLDLEIELTDRRAEISGSVSDSSGNKVSDYSVLVFSRDRRKWEAPSGRYVASAQPDQAGRFLVRTLPPGDYYIVALPTLTSTDWTDTEMLTRLASQATTVSLREDDVSTLALKVASGTGGR